MTKQYSVSYIFVPWCIEIQIAIRTISLKSTTFETSNASMSPLNEDAPENMPFMVVTRLVFQDNVLSNEVAPAKAYDISVALVVFHGRLKSKP